MSSKPRNNFDFLRMLAASAVILSHAFQVSYGSKINDLSASNAGHAEPLLWLSKGQLTLGHLSVLVFFVISGYLITMSQERSTSAAIFLKSRILRIFPALILVVLLTIFLLGPLLTNLTMSEYFSSQDTWKYLANMFLYSDFASLPGVFLNNPLPGIVNGSLWTLRFEFAFYLVVFALGITGLLGKKSTAIVFIGSALEVALARGTGPLFPYLLMFFSMGMMLRSFRDSFTYRGDVAAVASIVLVLVALFGSHVASKAFVFAFGLLGGYVVLYLVFAPWLKLHAFARYGDFSYGLYIYAFPIQQVVSHYLGLRQEWYLNFLISFPLTLICAYFSWHFIESKALALKGRPRPALAPVKA